MLEIPTVNMEMVRGDGEKFTLTVTQNGAALPLTGAQIWYTVKSAYTHTDEQALIRKGLEGFETGLAGITITNAAGGLALLELLGSDTEGVGLSLSRKTELFHDAQIQLPGEEPHTLFRGKLTVWPDVTRSAN